MMSSATAVSQATETNITALMSSNSYSWDCRKDCDSITSFCFHDECYSFEGCEGACNSVKDCGTCFCGYCFDDDNHYVTNGNVTNTLGSSAADSPKKPDTILACLVLAAVVLIGVIGLLVLRILKKSRYRQFDSCMEKTAVCVETTETEVKTKRKKSEVYF